MTKSLPGAPVFDPEEHPQPDTLSINEESEESLNLLLEHINSQSPSKTNFKRKPKSKAALAAERTENTDENERIQSLL
jgi:hypothetical protein